MEAIKSTKNKKSGEYDDSIRIDLCPMATHTKYRWIFNTTKVDWDLPKPEYEERTLAEKVAYDIQYPENYDKRVYDFFSWRFQYK